MPDVKANNWDEHFHGAVTVGERGQVVIPASVRKQYGIEPGDKMLIMADPAKKAVMLFKLDALREFMNAFQAGLARVEEQITIAAENGETHLPIVERETEEV